MVTKIISGAQTGADRAGLDAGLALNLEVGGWIPKGRRTEAGPLDIELFKLYRLQEHSSSGYPGRTEANVRDSDGTVLFGNMNSPGSRQTIGMCVRHNKPCYAGCTDPSALRDWLVTHNIQTLNVAGNRESTNPGIYQLTYNTLIEALSHDS
jgi:hypothetical protein